MLLRMTTAEPTASSRSPSAAFPIPGSAESAFSTAEVFTESNTGVIGQAGIFLICAQTVVHFRPKESYDKYLKLLLSVMLLLQLLQPVLSMFGGGDGWNAEEQVTGFMQELQTVLTRASEQAEQSQEEIGNTAAAVALEAGEGYDPANVWEQDSAQGAVTGENSGEVSDQKKTDRENAETEGIHVDIAPIRLE